MVKTEATSFKRYRDFCFPFGSLKTPLALKYATSARRMLSASATPSRSFRAFNPASICAGIKNDNRRKVSRSLSATFTILVTMYAYRRTLSSGVENVGRLACIRRGELRIGAHAQSTDSRRFPVVMAVTPELCSVDRGESAS